MSEPVRIILGAALILGIVTVVWIGVFGPGVARWWWSRRSK